MESRTIYALSWVVKGRRLELGLSQDDLAQRGGVSRKWVYEFEAGKPRAEIGALLRVLDVLGLALNTQPIESLPADVLDLHAMTPRDPHD